MKRSALLPLAVGLLGWSTPHFISAEDAPTGGTAKPTPPTTGTGSVMSLDDLFKLLDKDHDGNISKAEATGAYAQRFSQWDANGDGFATREEIHDFRTKRGIDDNGQRIAANAANKTPAAATTTTKTSTFLKEPTDWRLEALPIPPTFAPDISWKGTEEIRFAPGMFDTKSDSYFSCVIAIQIDGVVEPGEAGVKEFLEKYYRGLSTSRARRKGTPPDAASMGATITAVPPGADSFKRYTADVTFFDSFSDGRKVILHVEAQVVPQSTEKKTCVLLQVSPAAKDTEIWKTLRTIGAKSVEEVAKATAPSK